MAETQPSDVSKEEVERKGIRDEFGKTSKKVFSFTSEKALNGHAME